LAAYTAAEIESAKKTCWVASVVTLPVESKIRALVRIAWLRQKLDNPRDPRHIQTVARRGPQGQFPEPTLARRGLSESTLKIFTGAHCK
jgi:hypothetical protein